MPAMQRVVSSSIRAVGFDPERRRLYARYVESPQVYVYHDVPDWVYLELMQADSMGAYMNAHIKPHYEYTLLQRSD
jgi:hypothetical protein